MEQEQKLTADQIIKFLEERNFKELKEELENLHPVDLVDAMEELDKKQRMLVFRLLSKEEAAEVFTDMNSDMREELLEALTDSELKEIMDEMYVDDTVDVLEEMPANVVDRLLMATDEETRKQINTLLQYPEDSGPRNAAVHQPDSALSKRQCRQYYEYRIHQPAERDDGCRCDP